MATATAASRQSSLGQFVRVAAAAFVVVCLTGGPFVSLARWVVDEPVSRESWPYVYTFWGAALVGTSLFFVDVVTPMTARPLARSEILLASISAPVGLGLWALVSVAWSVAVDVTPGEALLVLLVGLGAVWFGYALTFRQQVLSLFVGLHALTFTSAVLALTLDSAVTPDDTWFGMFSSPDVLGAVAFAAVLVCLGAAFAVEATTVRAAVVICAAIDGVVAFKAESVTAWVAAAGAVIAIAVVVLARGFAARGSQLGSFRVGATIVASVLAVSIPWSYRLIAAISGDDSTLTARKEIWNDVLEAVEDRWIVGFGFGSTGDEENALVLGAFSSFMDVLLQLGAIGLLLVLVIVAMSVARTWWEALGGRSLAMVWWVGVVTFALFQNAAESALTTHSIFWVLLVAPAFAGLRAGASRSSPPPTPPQPIDRLALPSRVRPMGG
jgi:exopolysaccharide production protein ExoQ